jgi:hypothetical protein
MQYGAGFTISLPVTVPSGTAAATCAIYTIAGKSFLRMPVTAENAAGECRLSAALFPFSRRQGILYRGNGEWYDKRPAEFYFPIRHCWYFPYCR